MSGSRAAPSSSSIRADIEASSAPVAAEILRELGFEVRLVTESAVDLSPDKILLVRGSPLWYRRTLAHVAALEPDERPCVVVWHTEALPMPSAFGLPSERLTAREVAKILLRDRRINDHYSNARYFRHLSLLHVTTAVAVANRAYQAYLARRASNRSSSRLAITRATGTCWSSSARSTSCFWASTACAGAGESYAG